jgi:hypothetical protein
MTLRSRGVEFWRESVDEVNKYFQSRLFSILAGAQ